MDICVLAETRKLDIEAYQQLTRKIIQGKNTQQTVKFLNASLPFDFSNKGQLISQLHHTVTSLADLYPKLDFIVIVVDSDETSVSDQLKEINSRLEKTEKFPHNRIVMGVAKKSIEAWLLCDENAIRRACGIKISKPYKDAEAINDPKSQFRELWARSGKKVPYPTFGVAVAQEIDCIRLLQKSKQFSSFYSSLRSLIP